MSPRVAFSLWPPLRAAAGAFCPPYRVAEERKATPAVVLSDPAASLPDLRVGYRVERRFAVRTAYLTVQAEVPGAGPVSDAELRYRKRARLRGGGASFGWERDPTDGGEWLGRLSPGLDRAASEIRSIESLTLRWSTRSGRWRFRLETLSGSVVAGGFMAMPIPVPIEKGEVRGILRMLGHVQGAASG
jgi:hypothetical protein